MKFTKSGTIDKRTKEGKEFYAPENLRRGWRFILIIILGILAYKYFSDPIGVKEIWNKIIALP